MRFRRETDFHSSNDGFASAPLPTLPPRSTAAVSCGMVPFGGRCILNIFWMVAAARALSVVAASSTPFGTWL